jgi:hypothetical protein
MAFIDLMNALASVSGLDKIALAPNGVGALLFDQTLQIDFEYQESSGDLMLACVIGEYLPDCEAGVMKALAEANFVWAGTGGATLGANTDAKYILLAYRENTEHMDWPRFSRLLEGFLATAEQWRTRLATIQEQFSAAREATPRRISTPGACV